MRGLTLRSVEKIITYMSLGIIFTTKKGYKFFRPSAILAGLCVLKTLEPELFQKAKSGLLGFEEAAKAFRFSQWPNGGVRDRAQKW